MTQPVIKRSNIKTNIGVEVDTLNISLLVNADVQQANIPLTQFAMQGGFDGARLTVDRFFAADWGQTYCGSLSMFTGRVSEIDITGTEIRMEVKSDLELLNIKMPRNLYQAGCIHTLYDVNCAANASAFTVAANVAANSTRSVINTDLANADGYFDLGVIVFDSGQNAGESRTVKTYASGIVTTTYPFPYVPVANDTVSVRPGCDKSQTTCNAKFNNIVNFRAFPYIPVPEASY